MANERNRKAQYGRILLVQLGDIGDVVLTTPTIRAVKEAYPGACVSVMVRKPYGSLLTAEPCLDEVVEAMKVRGSGLHVVREHARFIGRLRRARYDLVIDLRTGDRGAFLSFLTGAGERVGRHGDEKPFWHDLLFTKIIRNPPHGPPSVHPGADQSLRVVRELGIDTLDSTPRLHIEPSDRSRAVELLSEFGLTPGGRWVTLNPFSRWSYKEWSNDNWRLVVEWLWERHQLSAVLIGSLEEAAASARIIAGREGHACSLAGMTTLGELAAVLSMSMLHVGVDSAAPHIAAALGAPTVTIHGPSDWRSWRVVDDRHKVVSPALDCAPCRRMGCEDSRQSRCLEQLEVEAVVSAIEEVLQKSLLN